MINTLFIGLSLGAVYGLIAVGFALIYRTTGVMNFAQGVFVMLGGVGTGFAAREWGWGLLPSSLFGLLLGTLAGLLLGAGVVLPLWKRGAAPFVTILGTLLFLVAAENVVLNLAGSDPLPVERLFGDTRLEIGSVRLDPQGLLIVAVAVAATVGLTFLLDRTRLGLAMKAVATNQEVARLQGVNPRQIALIAFAAAALLGAIAGLLIAPVQFAAWNAAALYNVKGFIAAVLGGLVNIRAALLGGLVLGVTEALIGVYISSTYLEVALLGVLLVLIVLRPSGLFVRHAHA